MIEDYYFVEAAMRYEELIETGQSLSVEEFVAGEPADVRDELLAFLKFDQDIGALDEPASLAPEQERLSSTVLDRARATWLEEVNQLSSRNLTMLRNTHKLTLGKLARQLKLPVDLLARIERGKVAVATLPLKLMSQLADALQETTETIRIALLAPPPKSSVARLSAADGTEEVEEPVVSFVQAFDESDPTAEERAEWIDEMV